MTLISKSGFERRFGQACSSENKVICAANLSNGLLIAGICQACILIRTGVMVLFEVMPHDDVRVGCLNVRNAVLEVRSRLNEVTATTVPVDHHRSGVRPAISGWV